MRNSIRFTLFHAYRCATVGYMNTLRTCSCTRVWLKGVMVCIVLCAAQSAARIRSPACLVLLCQLSLLLNRSLIPLLCSPQRPPSNQRLTGGTLLSRDKFFIVMFRGKDFLPPLVAATLEQKQQAERMQADEEERRRLLSLPSLMLPAAAANEGGELAIGSIVRGVWWVTPWSRNSRWNAGRRGGKENCCPCHRSCCLLTW